jgi:hypothetical protein
MGPPGDEARSGHRLFRRGLAELMWSGVVEDSEWIIELEHRDRVHPDHARFSILTHFIVPLKDETVEVMAEAVEMLRHPGLSARRRLDHIAAAIGSPWRLLFGIIAAWRVGQ